MRINPHMADAAAAAKVRLVDVAKRCGVSRATVARVLLNTGAGTTRVSAATAKRITAMAQACGYVPNRHAQVLRGKRSRMIAVLLDGETAPAESRRVVELQRQAAGQDYQLLVGRMPHVADAAGAQRFLGQFMEIGVDALILMDRLRDAAGRPIAADWDRFPRLICHGEAAQVVGRGGVLPGVEEGSRLAVAHLLATGRRRVGIALLGGPLTVERRLFGCRQVFAAAGRPFPDGAVWLPPSVDGAQVLTPALADAAVAALVAERGCDGLVVENDHWAARIIQALPRTGRRVPADVAVVGYGNLDLGEYTAPSLTTIDEAEDRIAAELFAMALGSIEGAATAFPTVVVAPRLVRRESA